MATVEIKLSKPDRTYRPGDTVEGAVQITAPNAFSHTGIKLVASGMVALQVCATPAAVLDGLYTTLKPLQLLSKSVDLKAAGPLPKGVTQAIPGSDVDIYETYHGSFVNIQYMITAEVKRGVLMKAITGGGEFLVEGMPTRLSTHPEDGYPPPSKFLITPDSQSQPLTALLHTGGFRVSGFLPPLCPVTAPVWGAVQVEKASLPIVSIECKLMRVERVGGGSGGSNVGREVREIQSTQIADGDVCEGLDLPIYIILPRLFTCPTLIVKHFSVEFEVHVVVTFKDSSKGARGGGGRQGAGGEKDKPLDHGFPYVKPVQVPVLRL